MAAKGSIAKTEVIKRVKEAFGDDFVGESGGKLYVWANDGGEQVQIAMALTCPKVPLEVTAPVEKKETIAAQTNWNVGAWGNGAWDAGFSAIPVTKKVEITQEERDNIENLIKKLDL